MTVDGARLAISSHSVNGLDKRPRDHDLLEWEGGLSRGASESILVLVVACFSLVRMVDVGVVDD